jgi:transglutaminase-like putative cysteine protease
MYDIRQFRPTLYWVVALGFLGFCLAVEMPLLLLLSLGAVALNWMFLKSGRFVPLPRWAAGTLTILGGLYVLLRWQSATAILLVGEFLLILQIVKLFEQRANRDYAQLLVLSLLLMVAAIISTASLLVGIIMIAYLLLSLYCCLLFHLKVETEHARRFTRSNDKTVNPITLRQDLLLFNRSMSRLTSSVAVFALAIAVVVFLFFPRGRGAGVLFGAPLKPSQSMTGFSDQVSFRSVSRIQQNNAEVAWLRITRAGERLTTGPIYLRGGVYFTYDARPDSPTRWQWHKASAGFPGSFGTQRSSTDHELGSQRYSPDETFMQEFVPLHPTGANVLFAMPGVVRISSPSTIKLQFSVRDDMLSTDPVIRAVEYTALSTGVMPDVSRFSAARFAEIFASDIDPAVAEYARRPEVAGTDDQGRSLAEQLTPGLVNEVSLAVARNIERHLQTQFGYTLDLTGVRGVDDDSDPIADFLTNFRKGHCEYFAGAMTLMCQSLGIPARLITGFRVDEYNATPGAGYFIVRQSHAHAWVEVLTPEGWKTFDPTSGNDLDSSTRTAAGWQRVRHFLDFLEYTWANNVIAYDVQSQSSLFEQIDGATGAGGQTQLNFAGIAERMAALRNMLETNLYGLSERIMFGLIVLMVGALLVFIGWYLRDRIRLRRRAARIGLDEVDPIRRLRLAEQLAFYDRMLLMLDDRGIARAEHQTPMEFARSLAYLPSEATDIVLRLTRVFYRIRFGDADLAPRRLRRLDRSVERLQAILPPVRRRLG